MRHDPVIDQTSTICRDCLKFFRVKARCCHLSGIVGSGVPVQGGCAAVSQREWRNEQKSGGYPFLSA